MTCQQSIGRPNLTPPSLEMLEAIGESVQVLYERIYVDVRHLAVKRFEAAQQDSVRADLCIDPDEVAI